MSEDLLNLFELVATRPPEFVVGWRDGVAVQNAAFLMRITAWRSLLKRTEGQNFALFEEDSLEFAAALLGAWQAGKTVWLTADTLAESCHSLQASVDGFLGDFPDQFAAIKPETGLVSDPYQETVLPANFNALVVHTSGSTGAAQAIPKQWSQLATEIASLEVVFGPQLGAAEIIATVSHQHIYGLLFKVLWPLATGRSIHARSQNFPEELAVLLGKRPCALITSPAHLKRLPMHLAWSGAQQNLRAVFSSGGPLAAEVARSTGALLGQIPLEVYGSSETGGIAWRQRGTVNLETCNEAWLPLPGVKWRIAIEQDLLEVRSPHLAEDAWMRLADRAQIHTDECFLLNGRSDRIVKIEEKRISLDAIEARLLASPLIAEVRVIVCDALPGQRQRLAAFVVATKSGKDQLAKRGKLALNRCLLEHLDGFVEALAFPRRWRYLDALPVDAQGKTTHALLTALLDERPRSPQLRLLERAEFRVELEVIAPANLYYFDGHFSQAAVLPGVVQVDWAIQIGREHFALPKEFRAIHALKFQHIISADMAVKLELIYEPLKASLSFRYFSADRQHASGRILFTLEQSA